MCMWARRHATSVAVLSVCCVEENQLVRGSRLCSGDMHANGVTAQYLRHAGMSLKVG
jgi:hypothetical protein